MDLKKIFETTESYEIKLVMINHHLVVFIQHDTSELRGLKSCTLAEIEPYL